MKFKDDANSYFLGSCPYSFSIAGYLAERELPFYDVSSFSEARYQPKLALPPPSLSVVWSETRQSKIQLKKEIKFTALCVCFRKCTYVLLGLTGKLNICPKHIGCEFAWSLGKARGDTSAQGRTELVSLRCSSSSVWNGEVCSCSDVFPGWEQCWLSLPAMIRPPGGDHSKHAVRILLSQELHEARMYFCHLFRWKLLAASSQTTCRAIKIWLF